MIEKSNSTSLALATIAILGQPPRQQVYTTNTRTPSISLRALKAKGAPKRSTQQGRPRQLIARLRIEKYAFFLITAN